MKEMIGFGSQEPPFAALAAHLVENIAAPVGERQMKAAGRSQKVGIVAGRAIDRPPL